MKRFRLSTLMLLVVITALGTTLVVQQRRSTRREAELQAKLNRARSELLYHTLVTSADPDFPGVEYVSVNGGGKAARAGMEEQKGRGN